MGEKSSEIRQEGVRWKRKQSRGKSWDAVASSVMRAGIGQSRLTKRCEADAKQYATHDLG